MLYNEYGEAEERAEDMRLNLQHIAELEAALVQARNTTLEEAAVVADGINNSTATRIGITERETARAIAERIRALKTPVII